MKKLGITPACAGTTYLYANMFLLVWDHPRMCGDHLSAPAAAVSLPGSPPHVRGPQILFPPCRYGRGITPACAGTTNNLSRQKAK